MSRRTFTGLCGLLLARLGLPQRPGTGLEEIRAWQVCECDCVWARTKAEALAWYVNETGVETEYLYTLREIYAVPDDTVIWIDHPQGPKTTLRERLQEYLGDGLSIPALACSSEY